MIGLAGVIGGKADGIPVGACFGTDCCGVAAVGVPTIEELDLGPCKKASSKEVHIKTTATIVVNLVRKVEAPLLPKIV